MSDFTKTILKWLLVVILTILVILLIIGIANKNSKNKNKNQPIQAIEKIKLDEEEEDVPEESSMSIHLGDTGSNRGITVWIGVLVLGGTSFYIYRNRKVNE